MKLNGIKEYAKKDTEQIQAMEQYALCKCGACLQNGEEKEM